MAQLGIDACAKIVQAATSHCSTVVTQPASAPVQLTTDPKWDSVTTSLTDLSTAITYGMFVIAVIGLLGLIAFAYCVRLWAKAEARKAVEEWFDKEAPAILKELQAPLKPQSDGPSGGPAPPEDAISEVV